jgi:hypothetical protein
VSSTQRHRRGPSGRRPSGSCPSLCHMGAACLVLAALGRPTRPLSRRTGAPETSATRQDQETQPEPGLVHVGSHPIGTERFPIVTNGSSFTQVPRAITQKQARVQNPDIAEVTWPVMIDLAGRSGLCRARPGLVVAAPVGARSTGRRPRRCWPRQRACRTSSLASHKQIAADLLPEAGGSGAIDGGEGR